MTFSSCMAAAALAAMTIVGCSLDVEQFQEQISAEFEKSEGVEVDIVVRDVMYFPVTLLEWAKERKYEKGTAVFARIRDSRNSCYLVGPDIALATEKGSRFRGVVTSSLVYQWPLELFTEYPHCMPMVGVIISRPTDVILSDPKAMPRQ